MPDICLPKLYSDLFTLTDKHLHTQGIQTKQRTQTLIRTNRYVTTM